jgi:hypothetical protein
MLRAERFGGMARRLRVQYPGAIYHVMSRGDRREELLDMIEEQRGEHHVGEELGESDEQKACWLTEQMLAQAGWTEQDLPRRLKSDPVKVKMATRLRVETTMSWKWIAEKLRMGNWRSAANAVRLAQG